MAQYDRQLSNMSYTNKDFGNIYPELLDLIKKISYRWDPSLSDESDPGAVIVKLNALMADKNNYNIDKNILELFPNAVTQEGNAREIFDQCGYNMKWYQSGTLDVGLTFLKHVENSNLDINDDNIVTYTIPAFTMVSDNENRTVYTLLKDALVTNDGVQVVVSAKQGTIQDYTMNGNTLITLNDLDYNNRLYFNERNIAENGIFIQTVSSSGGRGNYGYDHWTKVDNLVIQELKTPCYKFGVTRDGSRCYIEFPSDIANIIEGGLNIKYLLTDGFNGNIGRKRLQQYFTDVTASIDYYDSSNNRETAQIVITTENIHVTNISPSSNGKDPESIDEGFENYTKIKNTFETLVSLNDYNNFIASSGEVSNCFTCDRTNDIQYSYSVITTDGQTNRVSKNVEHDKNVDGSIGAPKLQAFDLKLYALQYQDIVSDPRAYESTFTLLDSNSIPLANIKNDIEDIKSIQHDFKQIENINKLCLIKNRYPIICKIVPQYKVTSAEATQISDNVKSALYDTLNSKHMKFGTEVDYDLVYDTIMNADARIKAIVLDDIVYTTYGVYYDGYTFEEINLTNTNLYNSDAARKSLQTDFRNEIYAKCILAGKTPLFKRHDSFNYNLNHKNPVVNTRAVRMSTNLNAPFVFDSASSTYKYDIRENENIILTSANLITKKTYANYCKFVCKLLPNNSTSTAATISKDCDYQLKENEEIIFFWKNSSDENASYSYAKYTAGDIICPNYTLKLESKDNGFCYQTNLNNTIFSSISNACASSTGILLNGVTIDVGSGPTDLNTYLQSLMSSTYVLSGTNQILYRDINTLEIKNRGVYWVLNKVTISDKKENYRLFNLNETEYTLQEGESFIYTNESGTRLYSLGSGTTIKRSGSTTPWECPVIDYEELLSQGVDYLEDKWFNLSTGLTVTAIENRIYQFASGTTISLANCSTDVVLNSATKRDLSSYIISYKEPEGEEIYLPQIVSSDPSVGWKGYTVLNVKSSVDSPMYLNTNQSITIYPGSVDTGVSVYNVNDKFDINTVGYVSFYPSIDVLGGNYIDITYLNDNDILCARSIYRYTCDEYDSNHIKHIQPCTFKVEYGHAIESSLFSLTEGTYIFKLTTTTDYKEDFDLDLLDSSGNRISSGCTCALLKSSKPFKTAGIHYIRVDVGPGYGSVNIKFKFSNFRINFL